MQQRVSLQSFEKVFILYNRYSGKQIFASMPARVNEIHKRLKDNLPRAEVKLVDVKLFQQLPDLARKVAQEKYDWVIIAGGDGTIRAFVEQMLLNDFHPYVSVIPAGTVNLIAKEMGLSKEPERWMRRAMKGIVVPLYLGRANGNLFLTVAGVGFDSLVVDNVGMLEKRFLSKFAYLLNGTSVVRRELLFSDWRYEFEARFDGEGEWHKATSVIVGKSRYYAGRYNLFTDASLSEPWLYTALFPGKSRADILKYASLIGLEALTLDKKIVCKKAKKVEIRSVAVTPEFPVELDGDVVTSTPLTLTMEDTPLKFIL